MAAISTGTFVEPSPLSANSHLAKWFETAARPRVTEHTFQDYQRVFERYIKPAPLGAVRLSDLRPLAIQHLYADLLGRGLSARTVRYVHSILSSALKQAVRWGMLSRNPASLVELPKLACKEMRAQSPDEAGRFLKAAAKDRWGFLFAFALATGMRPEEYLGLQWKDVDFEQGAVTVRRALIWRVKGG